MVILGRRQGGDARTHNLPLTGIYKGILAQVQNLAYMRTYTFRMKSTEIFINETLALNVLVPDTRGHGQRSCGVHAARGGPA